MTSMNHLIELNEMHRLLSKSMDDVEILDIKRKKLLTSFEIDLEKMVNKYESRYYKYIIQNKHYYLKPTKCEKEKEIEIVNKSLSTFMPYIFLHNMMMYDELND